MADLLHKKNTSYSNKIVWFISLAILGIEVALYVKNWKGVLISPFLLLILFLIPYKNYRFNIFLILSVFFVSFFTNPTYFFFDVTKEEPTPLIYQKGDNELLSENYKSSMQINNKVFYNSSIDKDFSKSSVLGIPLDWLQHMTCFEWQVTLIGSGGSPVAQPVPTVLVTQKDTPIISVERFYTENRCINTDDYNTFELRTINVKEEMYLSYIKDNKEILLKNCKPIPKNLDQCIVPAQLNFKIKTRISSITSFIGAYVLAATLSVSFLTVVWPKFWQFLNEEPQ